MQKVLVVIIVLAILVGIGFFTLSNYVYIENPDNGLQVPATSSPVTPETPATTTVPNQPTGSNNSGTNNPGTSNPDTGVYACTMDAKMCPDGSYVGRSGPRCEFTACPSGSGNTPAQPSPQSNLTLKVGQTGTFENFSIKANPIIEDSRCPIDVVCIQAGTVRVSVFVQDGARSEKIVVEMNKSYTLGSFKYSLTQVLPAPRSSHQISQEDYSLTFNIARNNIAQ